MSRALVQNAADVEQVRRAERKARTRDEQLKTDAARMMASPEARRVMWHLLSSFGVFGSIWENSAKIHYNAGRQDAGHELMALLMRADEGRYEQMAREAREADRRFNTEVEALHTPRAEELNHG